MSQSHTTVAAALLSAKDVEELLANPSPDSRADLVPKVVARLAGNDITDTEKKLAEDILRLLSRDIADSVRAAVADSVRLSDQLPRDIAVKLSQDIEKISLPILEFSQALTDQDLLGIIAHDNQQAMQAIAKRQTVSEDVSTTLMSKGDKETVVTLLKNDGVAINQDGFNHCLQRFGADEDVQKPLVERPKLPATIAEKLVELVSGHLLEKLIEKNDVSSSLAGDLVLQARERSIMGMVAQGINSDELTALVKQLHHEKRLTASLIIRALCVGDLLFFETALATLADIHVSNARKLIHDGGSLGLKSLIEKTGLSPSLITAMRVALSVIRETPIVDAPDAIRHHRRLIIERILTQFEQMPSEDLDYLIRKMPDLRQAS
ncbi:MAG: DUF2336 domain-containing protein [Alphaproteobacteria bacterium]